ncbi:unnamed protein product [Dicrocoelium dendriticum]|nr:unnamed protein product [Dicrocoelium dendriticum]
MAFPVVVMVEEQDNSVPVSFLNNSREAVQIVDLEQFLGGDFPSSCDLDRLTELREDESYDDALPYLVPNEALYSRYLNGSLSFDELMREMHRKETPVRAPRTADTQKYKPESDEDIDSSEQSETSDPEYIPRQKVSGSRRTYTTRRNSLPVELAQYLGEAERCLNNDQFEEAENICQTIIRSAPTSSQPYIVMAEVYYRKGDQEKSKEFLLAAAERNPADSNLWMSLIEFAEEKNDLASAMHYTKLAVRYANRNSSLRQRLIQYYEKAGRSRDALSLKVTALSRTPAATGEEHFRMARSLADEFFKLMDRVNSIRAYEAAFEHYPNEGTDSDKNTVLSMMLQLEKYDSALRFFLKYCGVSIGTVSGKLLRWDQLSEQLKRPNRYTVCKCPDTMSPELYLKLLLVLIRLKLTCIATPLVRSFVTNEIAERFPDWLFDIAQSYRLIGLHSAAGELLLKMSSLDATKDLPRVWTMLAEVQVEQGMVDAAIRAYRHVVDTLDPRHTEARLALGGLLQRIGRQQEALDLLKPSNVVKSSSLKEPSKKPRSTRTTRRSLRQLSTHADSKDDKTPRETTYFDSSQLDDTADGPTVVDTDLCDNDADSISSDFTDRASTGTNDDEDQAEVDDKWLESSDAVSDAALLSSDPVAYKLAFERCRMLDHPSSLNAFVDEAWNVLFTDVERLCGPDWIKLSAFLESTRLRVRLMLRLGTNQRTTGTMLERGQNLKDRNVTGLDIWTMFLRLIDVLRANLPHTLAHLESAATWGSLLPAIFNNEGRKVAAGNLLISSCIIGRHGTSAFIKLKDMHRQWSHCNQYWNLLNIAINLSRDFKHYRYLDRLATVANASLPMGIMSNNDCIVRGSYRFAIGKTTFF